MEKYRKFSLQFKQQNGGKYTKNINCLIILIMIIFIFMICSTVYRPNTRNDYDRVENSQKKITNEDKKYYEQWLEPLDSMRERPEFDHFIYTRMMGGGLGNQVCR
uniref:Uncharacterized protein n=1 Tax=Meloidogyne enterolobii TaxID=390850 RepID=A0A6V7WQ44_MELEN|nr:unnamed protein product [Meloidogyne enterolobii]